MLRQGVHRDHGLDRLTQGLECNRIVGIRGGQLEKLPGKLVETLDGPLSQLIRSRCPELGRDIIVGGEEPSVAFLGGSFFGRRTRRFANHHAQNQKEGEWDKRFHGG